MKNRDDILKERPSGRIQEGKSRSQMGREEIMKREEGERREIKVGKPQPKLSAMCVMCGKMFKNSDDRQLTCPKCSTPF